MHKFFRNIKYFFTSISSLCNQRKMNENDNYNTYTAYFPLLPLLYIHKCVYEPLHCVISVSHGRRKINEFDYFRRSTVSNIHKIHRKSSCIFAHPIFFFLFLYFSQSFPLLIFALKTTIRCIVIISSNNNKNNKGGGT